MWLNLKPYTNQLYSPVALPYTLGVSSSKNIFDQKRNLIHLRPGNHISIKVLPRLIKTSTDFDWLDIDMRKCKLPYETEGFQFLTEYTRRGCEFECAAKKAIQFCKCMPWYIPNNSTSIPICDMFGGYCFNTIMSDETFYKQCPFHCLEECREIALTTWPVIVPLELEDVCKKGGFFDQQFESSFEKFFAFESYTTLVDEGLLPELATRLSNGSLCKEYVTKYVVLISVESPTSSIVKSKRESYTVTFNDQMGTIGGTLGLFTGMSILSIIEVIFLFIILGKGAMNQLKEKYNGSIARQQLRNTVLLNSQNQLDKNNLMQELLKRDVSLQGIQKYIADLPHRMT